MRILVASIAAAFALVGCATTPLPSSQAQPAPLERILAFQDKTESKNATLVLTRDVGYSGSGCHIAFWINNVLAARLSPGETCQFYLEPGEQLLKASRDPLGKGLCAIDVGLVTQRETILRHNERKAFRLLISEGGVDIQRSE